MNSGKYDTAVEWKVKRSANDSYDPFAQISAGGFTSTQAAKMAFKETNHISTVGGQASKVSTVDGSKISFMNDVDYAITRVREITDFMKSPGLTGETLDKLNDMIIKIIDSIGKTDLQGE